MKPATREKLRALVEELGAIETEREAGAKREGSFMADDDAPSSAELASVLCASSPKSLWAT
jgi:hypothetical protein